MNLKYNMLLLTKLLVISNIEKFYAFNTILFVFHKTLDFGLIEKYINDTFKA